jgi:hypothetical protein
MGQDLFTWVAHNPGSIVLGCLIFIVVLGRLSNRQQDASRAMKALKPDVEQHARTQGRLPADELARTVKMPRDGHGVPLGYAPRRWPRRPQPAGVGWRKAAGHVGIFGPTGSGKGFHLTDTLLRWPGSALVVDPKSELWQRTAGTREKRYGPVFRIPESGFNLATLFDLGDPLARRELFQALLRPHLDREPHWLERVYPLFEAAHLTAKATNRHPLQLLARWSQMPPAVVLAEASPFAPAPMAALSAGQDVAQLAGDRSFASSWASFTSRLAPIAEQIRHLALSPAQGGVPDEWAEQRATVYLNFPIHAQDAVAPIVASLVAGVLRRLEAKPPQHRTLLALDEAPTVGLPCLSSYLATIRGERGGVTALVYCQSISQLEAVYGRAESEAIMSNFSAGQVFFPPRDLSTAQYLSRLFGEELEPTASSSGGASVSTRGRSQTGSSSSNWSVSTRYRRALTEAQALAMSEGSVAVFAAGKRAILVDSRTVLVRRLAQLAPPPEPEHVPELPAPPRASIMEVPRLPAPAPARVVTPPRRQRKPGETTAPATTEVLW